MLRFITGRQGKGICSFSVDEVDCSLYECVSKIRGKASDSTSSTDTWFLDMKEGSNVTWDIEGIPTKERLTQLFAKVWCENADLFNPSSSSPMLNHEWNIENQLSLDYESKVYSVVSEAVGLGVTNGFVRSLGTIKNCTFDFLLRYAETTLNKVEARNNLFRNLYHTILFIDEPRPSITTSSSDSSVFFHEDYSIKEFIKNRARFSMILTETGSFVTMREFFDKADSSEESTQDRFKLLFQAAFACRALYLMGITHNDLHPGNVFVSKNPRPDIPLSFWYDSVDSKPVVFYSDYILKLYDFDRSYYSKLGVNPKLEGYICSFASQCNYVVENKDIIKLLCYLWNTDLGPTLFDICSSNSTNEGKRLLKKVWNRGNCYMNKTDKLASSQEKTGLTKEDFLEFNSTVVILDGLSNKIDKVADRMNCVDLICLERDVVNYSFDREILARERFLIREKREGIQKDKEKMIEEMFSNFVDEDRLFYSLKKRIQKDRLEVESVALVIPASVRLVMSKMAFALIAKTMKKSSLKGMIEEYLNSFPTDQEFREMTSEIEETN